MNFRINGLVKSSRSIRQMLQAGLEPYAADTFREHVTALLAQVEDLCAQHGITPEQLPTPSRNAYRSLQQIDLEHLPIREKGVSAALPVRPFRIAQVVKTGKYLVAHIWEHRQRLLDSPKRQHTLLQQISRHCDTIERLCDNQHATPAVLELPSRQVYCWMKFLLEAEHLKDHLKALLRAEQLADPFLSKIGAQLQIHMSQIGALWRLQVTTSGFLLKCSEGFIYAPDQVWEAIFGTMLSRRTARRKTVVAKFLESEECTSVLFELQAVIELSEFATKGVVHDLDESFMRVNEAYFDGQLTKPRIHWSETPTSSTYGHYQSTTDTVMLSSSLDRNDVPIFVVDFVMYHELLHKVHGIQLVNGRRIVHSAAFQQDERRFERYQEAELFLLEYGQHE